MADFEFDGEHVRCELCGSDDQEQITEHHRGGIDLTTVICRECGLVFSNPMPTQTELDRFYRLSYRTTYKGIFVPRPKHVYRSCRRALPRARRIRELGWRDGRLLDVGSGSGEFLYVMRELGFETQGIEPNDGYARFATDQLGVDVAIGPLERSEFSAGTFDVITAHHVVEHLRHPVAALRTLAAWLNPNGLLIIEVPNVQACYHAPRHKFHFAHVYNFSPETLSRTGRVAGLEVVDARLEPRTRHVNVAFQRGSGEALDAGHARDPSHYQCVRDRIHRHTALGHALSHHPYTRLAGNLLRPVNETLALRGRRDPREVLDAVLQGSASLLHD